MGAPAAAAGSTKRRSRRGPAPEINVTPLVDVVLVLLIIMMVVAPELEHGERVELPAVSLVDDKPKAKLDPVTITVGASGALFFEKERLADRATLGARLKEVRAREPERKVVIKGDVSLAYEQVRAVFATCQEQGFSGVSLQVNQKSADGADGAQRGAREEG